MSTTTTAPTATATLGELVHIDPATVVVEKNVRTTAPLSRAFIASIKAEGVLSPILAHRNIAGDLVVRAGQRRTLAAREARLSSIPAYVVDAADAVAERIVQQVIENDQRLALTDSDRVAAFQQLAFEGMSETIIAKRLGTTKTTVKTGLQVAANKVAAAAISTHQLTLDQAAALVEFEGDDDTLADLMSVATHEPEMFAHTVQRARDDRDRAAALDAKSAELTGAGFVVYDRYPSVYGSEDALVALAEWTTSDGDTITETHLTDLPGRAAYVQTDFSGGIVVRLFLPDPKSAGFKKRTYGVAPAEKAPWTEEQKAERRTLIANNKAWKSAEVVRREWLTTLLSRKALPKGAATVIAQGLTLHRFDVGDAAREGNTLAHTLLGLTQGSSTYGLTPDLLAGYLDNHPTKANHVSLAIVLGGIESRTSTNTWRAPDARKAAYFRQLVAWGYHLSEVEEIVASYGTDS